MIRTNLKLVQGSFFLASIKTPVFLFYWGGMKLVNMFNTFETGFQSNQNFDEFASFVISSLFFAINLPLNASGTASLSFLVVMSLLFERNQAGEMISSKN